MMEWYEIYGYRFYDINIYTKAVRSHKHFKADPFHYMKQTAGYVTITDDYGKSKRVKVDDLYIQTFNMGHPIHPTGENALCAGGMLKVNRNFNISMDFSMYGTNPQQTKPEKVLIKPFEFINEN